MQRAYELISMTRRREMPTRVVVAAVLAAVLTFADRTYFPLIWLGLVFVTQLADFHCYRGLCDGASRGRIRTVIASTFVTSSVYSGLSFYLWTGDSEANHLLALLLLAGSLLHVAIHMYPVRSLLIAAAAPQAALFFALPLGSWLTGTPDMWAIAIGALLYAAHLAVAIRKASTTTREIQEARARAEQASTAKSDFLATISHEIRTPMNAIVSAANLLRGSPLSPAQHEQVEMLKDANAVLLSLLNDVLDLSKIEAGKLEIETADMDVARMLHGLQRLWQPKAADKSLRLDLVIAPDAPPVVRLDGLRVQQVLFNLISNAVKFTSAGVVTISLNHDLRGGDRVLVFRVSDTGEGIPTDLLPRLFGAFEQASAGTTRVHGGSGLGLAISRRLAGLMGGALEAESVLGVGSTFSLILPLVVGQALAPQDHEAADPIGLEGLRVLVAEDHPVNQRVLQLLLEPLGCCLTICDDGARAVAIARRETFDAILMDMQMPVLDGLAATGQIKSGGGVNKRTPVIALTANALEHHRAAWLAAGVDLFVSKPIEPGRLIGALIAARAFRDQDAGRRLSA